MRSSTQEEFDGQAKRRGIWCRWRKFTPRWSRSCRRWYPERCRQHQKSSEIWEEKHEFGWLRVAIASRTRTIGLRRNSAAKTIPESAIVRYETFHQLFCGKFRIAR